MKKTSLEKIIPLKGRKKTRHTNIHSDEKCPRVCTCFSYFISSLSSNFFLYLLLLLFILLQTVYENIGWKCMTSSQQATESTQKREDTKRKQQNMSQEKHPEKHSSYICKRLEELEGWRQDILLLIFIFLFIFFFIHKRKGEY